MSKSADAFRTISEVSEALDTPAHVLRFWESRFPQIRPVKRAGGRRYYRPADIALLTGIKHLLHAEGMTIRGVQKVLREQGVRYVSGLSGQTVSDEGDNAEAALEAALAANFAPPPEAPLPQEQAETAQVVALEAALRNRAEAAKPAPEGAADPADSALPAVDAPETEAEESAAADAAMADEEVPEAPMAEDVPLEPEAPSVPLGVAPPMADVLPLFDRVNTPAPPAPRPEAERKAPAEKPAPRPATAAQPVANLLTGPLLERMRALPEGSLASDEARALQTRLAALVARMKAPPAPQSGPSSGSAPSGPRN